MADKTPILLISQNLGNGKFRDVVIQGHSAEKLTDKIQWTPNFALSNPPETVVFERQLANQIELRKDGHYTLKGKRLVWKNA